MITITGQKFNSSNPLKLDQQQAYQFVFCKFDQIVLKDIEIPYLEFVGCCFDSLTLRNTKVNEVNFLGCLGYEGKQGIEIVNGIINRIQAMYSNICILNQNTLEKWQHGEQKFTHILRQTLRIHNQEQTTYENLKQLGDLLSNQVNTIPLVCIMLDSEWEIRRLGLEVLSDLYQNGLDIAHSMITNFLISFLDDEHPLVRYQAQDFVRDHRVDEQRVVEVFREKLENIFSSQEGEVLIGIELLLNIINTHSLDTKTIIDLVVSPHKFINHVKASSKELKLRFYELLDKFDDSRFNDVVVAGLHDSDNEIKLAAINLLFLLTEPPVLKDYTHLFEDKKEDIRAEAFAAAKHNGDFNESVVQEYRKIEKSEVVLQKIQEL